VPPPSAGGEPWLLPKHSAHRIQLLSNVVSTITAQGFDPRLKAIFGKGKRDSQDRAYSRALRKTHDSRLDSKQFGGGARGGAPL
jgi:hypothetical protein